MDLKLYLPFWNGLSESEKNIVNNNYSEVIYSRKTSIVNSDSCNGLMIIKKGKIRVFTTSSEGREITLYRLYNYDICLLSSSCIFSSITFDVMIEAEEETTVIWIPSEVYDRLMKSSIAVANYTNELMADRFSEVMWVLDQVLNKKMDSRIASFLIDESNYLGTNSLTVTHDEISRHLGSAREVISRLLRYFQKEKAIEVSRGIVTIVDKEKLKQWIN